jgi:hypothetical protein
MNAASQTSPQGPSKSLSKNLFFAYHLNPASATVKREELQQRLSVVGEQDGNRLSRFAEDVWSAVQEVQASTTALANEAQYHAFVESFIGPISFHVGPAHPHRCRNGNGFRRIGSRCDE